MKTPAKDQQESRKEAAYPYYDLEAAIKFASVIKDLGGSKSGIKKSLIAKQVGVAESTPSFFQKLSASKTFGVIEGWGEYGLTETGRNYFYPQSNEAQQQALLSLFITPSAFAFLLKRFDGEKLPSSDIVGNILHQELNVPDSWKDRVAQIFARSAQFVGIIDSGGFLRYDAGVNGLIKAPVDDRPASNEGNSVKQEVASAASPITRFPRKVEAPPLGCSQWIFPTEGTYIRLETPEKMTKTVWEKLNAYVQILKPSEQDGTA